MNPRKLQWPNRVWERTRAGWASREPTLEDRIRRERAEAELQAAADARAAKGVRS